MYIGVDYYPEHWPVSRWSKDVTLMKKAGFNVVRLAEFAWKTMEPEEGRFDFAWLDDALALLKKNGISAILGTPTGVMPAWCARKYPETLATEKSGQRMVWGVRKNNCYTSGTYRLLSERITTAMVENFKKTPNVIGWQTDNEFGDPFCFCDSCRKEFHDWLRAKYRSLEKLNRAWGTHFWNHQYSEWDEITLPMDAATYNPGLCLDWQRFHSWLIVRFQANQIKILRDRCPKHFITHNFMGVYPELNYFDLAADLDFVSWDNYPVWGKPEIRYHAAFAADLMRGLKKKNVWIMEQTAGPSGWGSYGRNPRPGEIRSIAFQQVGRGADGMVWFRWRSCTAGREQYWHGLLGHDGKVNRRYREAAQTANDLHRIERALEGTTVRTKVAMIYDYDSLWAVRIQPGYKGNDYLKSAMRYYNALFRMGVNVDMINTGDDFTGYKVIIAPDLYVLPDALAKRLDQFVKDGGVLVTDCRTGVKNEAGLCHDRTLPGLLGQCLGIEIPEYESLENGSFEYPLVKQNALGGSFTGTLSADWIIPTTAETLARYEPWHMQIYSAVTRNKYGKGFGYYVGTAVKEESFYDSLMQNVLGYARIKSFAKLPAGVEVSVRSGRNGRFLFIMNHTEEKQTVAIPGAKAKVLIGKGSGNSVALGRYGVAVVQLTGR